MEESEAPAFVACPYCRLELPRELIRSHVEDQHVASTLSSKKEDEEKEKSGSKKGGTTAAPSSTYNPNNSSRVDQTRAQENKNKNSEQAARKEKKSSQDPFEESLNFPQWSDSEDDPDPVEDDDEVSKRGGEGSKKTDPSTEEGRNSLEEAKLEMANSKKVMEDVKSNKDKLDKLRQSQTRSAQQESKNQNETRVAAPKTVMERLKEVERMTQLEKRSQAQKNQLQAGALRDQPRVNGKFASPTLRSQSQTQTKSQTQIKSAAPQPLEPQVALCGLCSFPNPFRTTQTLLAHVKRAHEKAAANNLAEIRHRVAPAKNYPATVGKNQGADDNQPVVDEEVVRDDILMPQIIRVTVLFCSH